MKAQLDLFEYVATSAQKMPDSVFTEPDDDWTPVMFLEGKQGTTVIPLHEYMNDDLSKNLLADVLLPMAIADFKATTAVMVVSTWISKTSSDLLNETGEYIRPSQQPDREELVYIMEFTREGVQRQAHAEILRSETEVPRLGEWVDVTNVESVEGRFAPPIVKALKGVRL